MQYILCGGRYCKSRGTTPSFNTRSNRLKSVFSWPVRSSHYMCRKCFSNHLSDYYSSGDKVLLINIWMTALFPFSHQCCRRKKICTLNTWEPLSKWQYLGKWHSPQVDRTFPRPAPVFFIPQAIIRQLRYSPLCFSSIKFRCFTNTVPLLRDKRVK